MLETVAIIGAGPLGRWLALAATRAGFRVQLEDVMPANLHHAQELLRQQLGPQPPAEAGLQSAENATVLKGHDFTGVPIDRSPSMGWEFSRAANGTKQPWALAPEESVKGTGFSRVDGTPNTDTNPQTAEKLSAEGGQGLHPWVHVTTEGDGGFNPRIKQAKFEGALAPEESVKGKGFSPYIEPAILERALAPEGSFSPTPPVTFVSTIEDAVRNADLVIDCVPDELESKLEILLLLDRMAPPRTVFATPTTRHSIADLANCTYRPTKCVAIVAEANTLTGNPDTGATREILLRTTAQTAPDAVALLDRFWRQLGFTPRFDQDPAS
ncbi:MAG: 3-hydroxyacyl-CoA dehydrogenase NAD-binding domain-containing protein [Terracidiphilus sp.]